MRLCVCACVRVYVVCVVSICVISVCAITVCAEFVSHQVSWIDHLSGFCLPDIPPAYNKHDSARYKTWLQVVSKITNVIRN